MSTYAERAFSARPGRPIEAGSSASRRGEVRQREPFRAADAGRRRADKRQRGLNRAMQDLVATTERPWHAETAEAALDLRQSSAKGLTSAEALKRLEFGRSEPPAGGQAALLAVARVRPVQQPPYLCPPRFGGGHCGAAPRARRRGHPRRRSHQRSDRLHPGGSCGNVARGHSRPC